MTPSAILLTFTISLFSVLTISFVTYCIKAARKARKAASLSSPSLSMGHGKNISLPLKEVSLTPQEPAYQMAKAE